MPQSSVAKDVRKLLAFGSGAGIEIGVTDLEVVAARVRPSRIEVLGRLNIPNYAERPAAEWGVEYSRFLKSVGVSRLSATVLLPRREVIVRQVTLPGVANKDLESAIRLQLDSLHPYGEEEVCWGWSSLGYGAALVGIARRAAVERYVQLFTEADIAVASFTFSAAAVHAAIRFNGHAASEGFVALSRSASGGVEIYGESASRPVFSAEFDMAPDRAAGLALSELRLPPATVPLSLEEVLPKPAVNPVENDLSRNALPYATALAGACPRFSPAANVLPPELRRFNSRTVFIAPAVLAGLMLLVGGAAMFYMHYMETQYLHKLEADIGQLQPLAQRAAALDRRFENVRARTRLLDQFRGQTRADLDAIGELTKLIEPPAWTSAIDLSRDSVRLTGEAPQAATLINILNSSPLFENSGLDLVQPVRGGTGETFQIHASRKDRK